MKREREREGEEGRMEREREREVGWRKEAKGKWENRP